MGHSSKPQKGMVRLSLIRIVEEFLLFLYRDPEDRETKNRVRRAGS